MDPATAIGLVGSIIGIIGGVADASNAIGKIADRPQAFHMVENDLPLISSILERADSNYNDEQGRLAEKTLQACKDNAEELKRIFVEIEMKCNEDKEAEKWTWSRAREWYRAALKHKKSYKVEKLMTAILEGMEKLAIDRIFRLHEDMEKITDALKELQNVEASLEDYELEEHGINSVTNVSGHGSAQVNNSTGNNHKFFHNHFAETVNSVSFMIQTQGVTEEVLQIVSTMIDPPGNVIKMTLASRIKDLRSLSHGPPRSNLPYAAPESYEWLYDHPKFKDWELQPFSENTKPYHLLLHGKAGSGKSVLMANAFTHLSPDRGSQNRVKVMFSFNALSSNSQENSVVGFLHGFLCQLLEQVTASQELWGILRDIQEPSGSQPWSESNLINTISQILALLKRSEQEVLLFVDAVDECQEDGKHSAAISTALLRLLGDNILRNNNNLKAIVSTREPQDIIGHSPFASLVAINLTAHNQPHIEQYLDAQLENTYTENLPFRHRLKKLLLERVSGMFLWARIVTASIQMWPNKKYSKDDLLRLVESLPNDLDGVYRSLLARMDQERRQEALALLQVIQVAVRPLTLAEAWSILNPADKVSATVDEDFDLTEKLVKHLHGLSGGLVEVRARQNDRGGPKVQFIHQSVKDFMRGGLLATISSSHTVDESYPDTGCHLFTAKLCMQALSGVALAQDDQKPFELEDGFVAYASQFWMLHARKSNIDLTPHDKFIRMYEKCTSKSKGLIASFIRSVKFGGNAYRSVEFEDIPEIRLLRPDRQGNRRSHNISSSNESSLLVLLAFEGCTNLVVLHATKCAKCRQDRDTFGRAFHLAVCRGWLDTAKAIWDLARPDLDIDMLHKHQTPLHAACLAGEACLVKFLLENGASLLAHSAKAQGLPLHTAVALGYVEVVEIIFKHFDHSSENQVLTQALSLKTRRKEKSTVLHLAVVSGSLTILQRVLDFLEDEDMGQLLFETSSEGETPQSMTESELQSVNAELAEARGQHGRAYRALRTSRKHFLEEAVKAMKTLADFL